MLHIVTTGLSAHSILEFLQMLLLAQKDPLVIMVNIVAGCESLVAVS